MKEPEPPRLPDDLLDYLTAAREPEPASPATKERLLARLVPLLPPGGGGGSPTGDGGGPSTGAESAATTAAGATAGALKGKLVVAAVSAMIGAVGGAGMHATFAPPKPLVASVPVSASVAPSIELPPVSSVAEVTSAEAASPSASVAIAPPPSASNESLGPRKSTMRAERILLEAANAALMRGDYGAAIASLQQHKQTYPRGELAQEREILMGQAMKLKASDKGSAPR